jgi:hypothetical protein
MADEGVVGSLEYCIEPGALGAYPWTAKVYVSGSPVQYKLSVCSETGYVTTYTFATKRALAKYAREVANRRFGSRRPLVDSLDLIPELPMLNGISPTSVKERGNPQVDELQSYIAKRWPSKVEEAPERVSFKTSVEIVIGLAEAENLKRYIKNRWGLGGYSEPVSAYREDSGESVAESVSLSQYIQKRWGKYRPEEEGVLPAEAPHLNAIKRSALAKMEGAYSAHMVRLTSPEMLGAMVDKEFNYVPFEMPKAKLEFVDAEDAFLHKTFGIKTKLGLPSTEEMFMQIIKSTSKPGSK